MAKSNVQEERRTYRMGTDIIICDIEREEPGYKSTVGTLGRSEKNSMSGRGMDGRERDRTVKEKSP